MSEWPWACAEDLARLNMDNVQRMFQELKDFADDISHESIAAGMGLPSETVGSMLDGDIDLTLSDLQQLALALGVRIEYKIRTEIPR